MLTTTARKGPKPTNITRLAKLLEVKQRVDDGVAVARACRDVGYPRSSYYLDIKKIETPAPQSEGSTQPEAEYRSNDTPTIPTSAEPGELGATKEVA